MDIKICYQTESQIFYVINYQEYKTVKIKNYSQYIVIIVSLTLYKL